MIDELEDQYGLRWDKAYGKLYAYSEEDNVYLFVCNCNSRDEFLNIVENSYENSD